MGDQDVVRGALARPLSRRQLLKGAAAAAGGAAFLAATGGAALGGQRSPLAGGARTANQESFAGTTLNGFSGGYSLPAEMTGLEVWKAATGGDAVFTNVPFDEKPLKLAGIIATQDPSWDLIYTYDIYMQKFGARMLLPLERHELTVNEICSVLQLPQSTVSRHLKTLADDRINAD